MVQYCFTSTETIRLVRTDSPGRPPPLSHSFRTLTSTFQAVPLITTSAENLLSPYVKHAIDKPVNNYTIRQARQQLHYPTSPSTTTLSDKPVNNYTIRQAYIYLCDSDLISRLSLFSAVSIHKKVFADKTVKHCLPRRGVSHSERSHLHVERSCSRVSVGWIINGSIPK